MTTVSRCSQTDGQENEGRNQRVPYSLNYDTRGRPPDSINEGLACPTKPPHLSLHSHSALGDPLVARALRRECIQPLIRSILRTGFYMCINVVANYLISRSNFEVQNLCEVISNQGRPWLIHHSARIPPRSNSIPETS